MGGVKRLVPLAAVLSVALAACTLRPAKAPSDASAFADNSGAFDAYTSKRAADLLRMGATKDRGEAEFQARTEAERRYGPRTPSDSAAWSASTARESRKLTSAEINKALGK
jgi:hypothetical protein